MQTKKREANLFQQRGSAARPCLLPRYGCDDN